MKVLSFVIPFKATASSADQKICCPQTLVLVEHIKQVQAIKHDVSCLSFTSNPSCASLKRLPSSQAHIPKIHAPYAKWKHLSNLLLNPAVQDFTLDYLLGNGRCIRAPNLQHQLQNTLCELAHCVHVAHSESDLEKTESCCCLLH